MKRVLVAVSFAVAVIAIPAGAMDARAPFEELNLQRTLPVLTLPQEAAPALQVADAARLTNTRSDLELAQQQVSVVRSAWVDQHDFIAPPQ